MPLVPLQNAEKLEQPTMESLQKRKLWVELRKRPLPKGFKNGKSVIIAKGCGVVDGGKRKQTRLF